MSDKIVRKHQNQSNRARPRSTADKKIVYKSVLDNPFHVPWPIVMPNVQNMLLARVIQLLDGVCTFQHARSSKNRRRTKGRTDNLDRTKPNGDPSHPQMYAPATGTVDNLDANPHSCAVQSDLPADSPDMEMQALHDGLQPPDILRHVSIGINEVTKSLEFQAKSSRQTLCTDAGRDKQYSHCDWSQLVFVCRADVNPPILIAHLPQLVASCNLTPSVENSHLVSGKIWLVPLPKGAEGTLADALGLRRVSVLSVKATAPGFSKLLPLLRSVPILTPPWAQATVPVTAHSIVPTHVKQLQTTAPRNIKLAREKRLDAKTSAKARRKARNLLHPSLPRRNIVKAPNRDYKGIP